MFLYTGSKLEEQYEEQYVHVIQCLAFWELGQGICQSNRNLTVKIPLRKYCRKIKEKLGGKWKIKCRMRY